MEQIPPEALLDTYPPLMQDTADALNSIFTYCGGDVRSQLKELNDTLAGDLKDQDLLK